jgi:hypothetical protein
MACWITRSSTVGIPSGRFDPSGFGAERSETDTPQECPQGKRSEVNPHPFDGRGPVVSFSNRSGNPRPLPPRERGEVRDGHAVDPRSTFILLHAFPRLGKVFRFKDFLNHGSFLRGSMLPTVTALKLA